MDSSYRSSCGPKETEKRSAHESEPLESEDEAPGIVVAVAFVIRFELLHTSIFRTISKYEGNNEVFGEVTTKVIARYCMKW